MLYLDEPTTGLDAATSMSVLRLLKRLAYSNNPRTRSPDHPLTLNPQNHP